jgi:hypothetical protein
VAHAVGEARRAEALGGGEDVDGFEEAGLAGAVAAEEEVTAGLGLPGERLEVAEAAGGELAEQAGRRPRREGFRAGL